MPQTVWTRSVGGFGSRRFCNQSNTDVTTAPRIVQAVGTRMPQLSRGDLAVCD